MPVKKKPTEKELRLKAALEPFLRVYRVSIEAFQGNNPDETGLREKLPGLWPTVNDLRALMAAAVENNMDYKSDESDAE